MGLRVSPFLFSEHGAVMLASVLNSERAITVNIQIIRIFNKMREMLLAHKDILLQLEQIQQKLAEHDNNILLIFEYIKLLEQKKQYKTDQQNRMKIGFNRHDD